MVIAGVLFVVFGLLLCLTIVLAPLGFFLIFLGLILFGFGLLGRRKTVITNVVQVSTAPQGMHANIPFDGQDEHARRIEPPVTAPPRIEPPLATSPRLIDVTPRRTSTEPVHAAGYDKNKWNTLVKYDDDIARIVKTLSPFGQKYVDELATAYLALNDKAYLPMIIQKILATAKADGMGSRTNT